jgi:hypothetical protein
VLIAIGSVGCRCAGERSGVKPADDRLAPIAEYRGAPGKAFAANAIPRH